MDAMTLDQFEEAYEVVKEVTSETKLVYSDYFSEIGRASCRERV